MSQSPYLPPKAPLESPGIVQARMLASARRFALGAMAMGALEILDAFLWAGNPRDPTSASYLIALLEIVWLILSFYVLARVRHAGPRVLAGAFLAFMAFGVGVSVVLDPPAPPLWALVFEGVFGAAYLTVAIFVRRSLLFS